MDEKHILFNGARISASMFDWGIYFFHNAKALLARGSGPYFYLPKLESHLEARLWNDVFLHAQLELGLPAGTIRATVLIETITGAFEAEEILYELREHMSGLNCGRWDYMFSMVKKFRNHRDYMFPDRTLITMEVPFMRAYRLCTLSTSAIAMVLTRWAEWPRKFPSRTIPRPTTRPSPRCAQTRNARPAPGTTAPGSLIPALCRLRSRPSAST